MTTTDNNKLLAEFLGYTQPHPDYPHTTYWYKKDEAPLTMLSFDTDWNWLMEVVNKVNRTIGVKTIDECTKEEWVVYGMVKSLYLGTPIDYVYNACVQFVQWYNKQNKQLKNK
jgi:hypothetical protein